jgi:hypothetical protein
VFIKLNNAELGGKGIGCGIKLLAGRTKILKGVNVMSWYLDY